MYGVQDLQGLIWEWGDDFGALLVSGDSRTQGDLDKLAFCGAGAIIAQDRGNYPILMRIAFLSALEGRSTARTLGRIVTPALIASNLDRFSHCKRAQSIEQV